MVLYFIYILLYESLKTCISNIICEAKKYANMKFSQGTENMQRQKNLADYKTYGMTQLYIITMRLKMFTLKLIWHENSERKGTTRSNGTIILEREHVKGKQSMLVCDNGI